MRIAVTGASGHIGANLCPYLLEQGYEVSVLINNTLVHCDGLRQIRGSVLDADSLDELIHDADVVVHMAAVISLEKDLNGDLWNINVKGTQQVVDACIAHGVSKLVHFSSIHRFDPAPQDELLDETRQAVPDGTDYDRSKIESEKIARQAQEHGITTTIIYPTSVIGPNDYRPSLLGQGVIDMYQGKVPILVPGGYNFVDVRDVVRGTHEVIVNDYPDEQFILAGEYLTIQQLAQLISKHSPNRVNTGVLPHWLVNALLPVFKWQSLITNKPPVLTKQAIQVLLEGPLYISTAKAERRFGYNPTKIQETIKDTIAWFKKERMI
jgi:dihydroflavonol-4-reductase